MEKAAIVAAFLSTTAISLLPNILLFLFPNYEPDSPMLSIGQALAAGALLGDVFLHTLPHAMMDIQSGGGGEGEGGDSHDHGHSHGHGHDHGHKDNGSHDHGHIESLGLAILVGFFVFFVFDIFVRSFGSHDHHNHDHAEKSCSKEEEGGDKKNKKSIFTSAVILNLIGDSLHNFTDGIAIGASFAAASVVSATLNHDHDHVHDHHHDHSDTIESSLLNQVLTLVQSRGGLASMAVLFHEIPHELGDFAILVSGGMSKKQAIKAQFSTAIAAYCGTFVGLFGMGYMKNIFEYDLMIPFTAGGFIYLAAVTILPSLLEEKRTLNVRMLQIMAFIVGIAFMYYVAVLEHGGGCSCCPEHLDLHTGHDHDHHGHDHTNEHHHDHHGHDHHDDNEL